MAVGVPVVDVSAVILGQATVAQRADAVRAVGSALEDWGFVAIVGHGIDPALLAACYAASADVFALPEATKRAYETPEDGRQRGYTSFGVEHAKDQPTGDLKEFWHVGRDGGEGIPANRFPTEVPAFAVHLTALFHQTERFAEELLSLIAAHLGLPADWFRPQTRGGNSVLRVIHSPPVGDAPPGAVRAAPHEDINLLTVLPVSTAPGLELLTRDGVWLPVIPPPGAVLCDTGDLMQRLTGGRLPATTHRVVNPEGDRTSSRYSLPFFMHPRPEMRLDQLVAAVPGEPLTAGEFLAQRLAETGVGPAKTPHA